MKAQTSTEIELNQATKRIDELTETATELRSRFQGFLKGFIDGSTPLDELRAQQSELMSIEDCIELLKVRQNELHIAYQMESLF
jgi:hypothetical protein